MIDPRAMRAAAWATTVVLAVVLLTSSAWLLAAQAVVFALGTRGKNPYALVFKKLVRTPPPELEDAAPPRFAQLVGLVFAVVGVLGFVAGAPLVGLIATAGALSAAFLNAAFGVCLGCEMYLILKRTKGVPA